MVLKDGKMLFDFNGNFILVVLGEQFGYMFDDGRKVWVYFEEVDGKMLVMQEFELENQNSIELQEQGWQNILNSYVCFMEKVEQII